MLLLCPGLLLGQGQGGSKRNWGRPVTRRAYLLRLGDAVQLLRRQRLHAKLAGEAHEFHGFGLNGIGTHSCKKTSVTLLKVAGSSSAVIAKIAGTSARTLDAVYDCATSARQRPLSTLGWATFTARCVCEAKLRRCPRRPSRACQAEERLSPRSAHGAAQPAVMRIGCVARCVAPRIL